MQVAELIDIFETTKGLFPLVDCEEDFQFSVSGLHVIVEVVALIVFEVVHKLELVVPSEDLSQVCLHIDRSDDDFQGVGAVDCAHHPVEKL